MRSTVIIERRGAGFICSVCGRYSGGYTGAKCGSTPIDAAAFAAREMTRYSATNPEGGDLIAPPEVSELVPADLKNVEGRRV